MHVAAENSVSVTSPQKRRFEFKMYAVKESSKFSAQFRDLKKKIADLRARSAALYELVDLLFFKG